MSKPTFYSRNDSEAFYFSFNRFDINEGLPIEEIQYLNQCFVAYYKV